MGVIYVSVVVLYLAVVLAAGARAVVVSVRAHGRARSSAPQEAPDLLEAAFLAGGPQRVADTAIAAMHDEGRLFVSPLGWVAVTDPQPRGAVEEALVALCPQPRRKALTVLRGKLMGSPAVQEIGDRLAARGLLVRPEWIRAGRTARRLLWAAGGLGLVAAVWTLVAEGVASWATAAPFLTGVALCAVTAALHGPPGRLTRAGQRLLDGHGPGRSPLEEVALVGVSAVRDTALRRSFRRSVAAVTAYAVAERSTAWCGGAWPESSGAGDSSDGGGSDGGGSGGGGAGCGSGCGSGCGGGSY